LPKEAVFDTRNTGEETDLPSYRRNKTTKRIITVVSYM
jgi:copper oxidase (laccase) domain-containing protein